jgi:hypothetical protein
VNQHALGFLFNNWISQYFIAPFDFRIHHRFYTVALQNHGIYMAPVNATLSANHVPPAPFGSDRSED